MRHVLIPILLICFFYPTSAQDKSLIVQGASPDIYLVHIILPKENYYSIGRMYNIPPKELGIYNHLVFEKGLSLGQTIKIPLVQNNFSQGEPANKDEALIPVYHIVLPKEGLYRISQTYNKVPLENLKRWNNLTSEVVSNGTRLIIGYLKVLKEQSPLAQKGVIVPKTNVAIKSLPHPDKTTDKPSEKPVVLTSTEKPVIQKVEIPVIKAPVTEKEDKDEVKITPSKPSIDFGGGYFKKLYSNQTDNKTVIKETGQAGVFKTTSGWTDGKYYCFHNEAIPGTVIRITNSITGKSVYAKVLDAVPDIRQNSGLLLRLSNSAAEELGAGESKFDCSISYSK